MDNIPNNVPVTMAVVNPADEIPEVRVLFSFI